MSDDRALANALAQIAALQRELAETRAALAAAEARAASAAEANAVALAAAEQRGASAAEANATATIIGLRGEVDRAQQMAASADASRAALAQKFEVLHGEPTPEEGIVTGSHFVTTADNQIHLTLQAARIHLIAWRTGLQPSQVETLVAGAGEIAPLLTRAAGMIQQ